MIEVVGGSRFGSNGRPIVYLVTSTDSHTASTTGITCGAEYPGFTKEEMEILCSMMSQLDSPFAAPTLSYANAGTHVFAFSTLISLPSSP